MINPVDTVCKTIERYDLIPAGTHVIVGLSGGADSVCLMEILWELAGSRRLQASLEAVHVHHGLRQTADRDEAYVRSFAEVRNIPLTVVHVKAGQYAEEHGLSTEEAGRILRQQAFAEAAEQWKKKSEGNAAGSNKGSRSCPECRIALAHHLEDSAETMLFHLCRGSRMAGLAGICPRSGNVIHPLIECSREEIEEFLRDRGITWCTDETNESDDYTRNFIRHQILPLLKDHINLEAERHIAGAALEAAECEQFLQEETRKAFRQCCAQIGKDGKTFPGACPEAEGKEWDSGESSAREKRAGCEAPEIGIRLERLTALPPFLQRRVLYEALIRTAGRKKDIAAVHVESLQKLCSHGGSAELSLPYGITARKQYGMLRLWKTGNQTAGEKEEEKAAARRNAEERISGKMNPESRNAAEKCFVSETDMPEISEAGFFLIRSSDNYHSRRFPRPVGCKVPSGPYTKWFDYDKMQASFQFRTRQPGDRMLLSADGGGKYKTLSRLFIDGKIPKDLRDRIVLPFSGQEVLWIPGGRISAAFPVTDDTKNILELSVARK